MTTDGFFRPKVSSEQLQFLIQEAKDYAFSTGFVMGLSKSDTVGFAPLCLFPSPFPEEWFARALTVQTSLNLMLHRVSGDIQFLKECLGKASLTDNFIDRLFRILETVLAEGNKQPLSLGVFRMDYMLDTDGGNVVGMKQIEMNTISTSFGSLATQIHPLQLHILKQMDAPNICYPESRSLHEIASGLASAWRAYRTHTAALLFVIETDVVNFADQRILEYAVYAIEPKMKVIRRTFEEIHSQGRLEDDKLFIGEIEVAVVYYRTGYMPNQYENENAWSVRLMLERSLAIQCPSVALQLAGMKKVQQELTRDSVLERFLPDVSPDTLQLIKSLFAGQYSLDLTEEGDKNVEMALANPERYVLKPQREGGGNNIFGKDIVKALEDLKGKDREAFVLMELISPPIHKNYILRKNQKNVTEINTVGELGIYGVILGDPEKIVVNYEAGHLLRCKEQGVNEGGVAVGYGALNLPYLV